MAPAPLCTRPQRCRARRRLADACAAAQGATRLSRRRTSARSAAWLCGASRPPRAATAWRACATTAPKRTGSARPSQPTQRSPQLFATARASRPRTYWSRARPKRSDGAQPHVVSIAFQRKVELLVRRHRSARPAHVLTWHAQELALYVDFKHDESYTPRAVAVKVGNSIQDMKARFGLDVRTGAQCSR